MRRTLAVVTALSLSLVSAACGDDENDGDGGVRAPAASQPRAAQERPVIGIGEQGAEMFGAETFKALDVTAARLVVPWDAQNVEFERELVDAWLNAAREADVEAFVTFGHSRVRPDKLPSVAEFRAAFRTFRERHPEVRVYAAWNEINHSSQPTDDDPRRAAEYYNVVRALCEGCTVLAGDFLDEGDMVDYLEEYRRHLHGDPEIWGLHNYADANRFRTRGLRELLRAVEGKVWLTETGGIVRFGGSFPQDERRAARATRFVLDQAERRERVERVYLYNWTAARPQDRFDAGLIGPDGTPRPAYDVVRRRLAD